MKFPFICSNLPAAPEKYSCRISLSKVIRNSKSLIFLLEFPCLRVADKGATEPRAPSGNAEVIASKFYYRHRDLVRDLPFNLKGGRVMVFCCVPNFFFGQHKS